MKINSYTLTKTKFSSTYLYFYCSKNTSNSYHMCSEVKRKNCLTQYFGCSLDLKLLNFLYTGDKFSVFYCVLHLQGSHFSGLTKFPDISSIFFHVSSIF